MKKALYTLLLLSGICFIAYRSGSKPEPPQLHAKFSFKLPDDLNELEQLIKKNESHIPGIKPDNEARIVWADSLKAMTDYAIVYIHGFSASHEEGAPVHENLAKKYGANLYKTRIYEHGIDRGDSTMIDFNADDFIRSGEEALAIGHKLGRKVVIVATSAGAALSLYLASEHPEIEALVLYSPCIEIYDQNAKLLDDPWGLQLANLIQGKPYIEHIGKNENQKKYWALKYRLEAVVELQNFLTKAMVPETFKKVKCPVFLGYYYEDEEKQDKVVSVKAQLKMFDELGSTLKEKVNFPNTRNHVLASWIVSDDVATVQQETEKFLDKLIR